MTEGSEYIMVIVPAFNEGEVLRNTVQLLLAKGYEVVVVDDGSKVPAADHLNGLSVTVIRHRVNLGQGAALQTGFMFARKSKASIVVTFDADGQHEADDIPSLVEPLINNQCDIAMGSRFLDKQGRDLAFSRKWVLNIARMINYLLTGLFLSDAHNGLRAMNKKAFHTIQLRENGMAHATEILFEVQKHQFRFCEVPVHIHYSDYSRRKGQPATNSVRILFDLVLHKLFQ